MQALRRTDRTGGSRSSGLSPSPRTDGVGTIANTVLQRRQQSALCGTIEVVVSLAGNRARNSELGRLQSRALAVPNEVLRVAGRAGIATHVVYISPIVEFRRVDAQKVVGGEELAAKGTVEGLLVLGVVVLKKGNRGNPGGVCYPPRCLSR